MYNLIAALNSRAVFNAVLSEFARDHNLAARARRDLDEAEAIAAGLVGPDTVVGMRVTVELILGDIAAASAATDALIASDRNDMGAHMSRAATLHILGDHEGAAAAAMAWLRYARRVQESVIRGSTSDYFSDVSAASAIALAGAGQFDEARTLFITMLERARRGGRPGAIEVVVAACGGFAVLRGDASKGARLLSWVRSRTIDKGQVIGGPAPYALYRHHVRLARAALDPDDARRLREEGAALSEDEACELALEVLHT